MSMADRHGREQQQMEGGTWPRAPGRKGARDDCARPFGLCGGARAAPRRCVGATSPGKEGLQKPWATAGREARGGRRGSELMDAW
jgi:hypothetical protein